MNRADYMAALRRALRFCRRRNARTLCAITKNILMMQAQKTRRRPSRNSASGKVAAQILADYRELTAVPHTQPIKEKRRWRGISPLLLIVLVLLAIPIGLPLVFGAGATVLGVLLAIVATVLAVIFAVLLILYGIPLALICGGA